MAKDDWYELHVQISRALVREAIEAAEAAGEPNLSQWVRAAMREKLERDRAAAQPA